MARSNSSATSTSTPRQLAISTTISPIPLSAASAAPTARRGPRRVKVNQMAALQPSRSPTDSTATGTSPTSATAATTAMTTGAISAITAAIRGRHRAARSLPGVAGVARTVGSSWQDPHGRLAGVMRRIRSSRDRSKSLQRSRRSLQPDELVEARRVERATNDWGDARQRRVRGPRRASGRARSCSRARPPPLRVPCRRRPRRGTAS